MYCTQIATFTVYDVLLLYGFNAAYRVTIAEERIDGFGPAGVGIIIHFAGNCRVVLDRLHKWLEMMSAGIET